MLHRRNEADGEPISDVSRHYDSPHEILQYPGGHGQSGERVALG